MNKPIKMSPKHGANPTIPICFWCGENREEVALLVKINKNDDKAPMNCIIDYEPCDKCKAAMKSGICLMGMSKTPLFENQPRLSHGYPTSQFIVVKPQALDYLIQDETLRASILKFGKAFIEQALLESLMGNTEKNNGGTTHED